LAGSLVFLDPVGPSASDAKNDEKLYLIKIKNPHITFKNSFENDYLNFSCNVPLTNTFCSKKSLHLLVDYYQLLKGQDKSLLCPGEIIIRIQTKKFFEINSKGNLSK
jgi:hypothetical protein